MIRIIAFLLAIVAGNCSAQEVFTIGDHQEATRDPMRDIIHFPGIGIYPVPADELTISEDRGMVRWNETLQWLGNNMQRRSQMTILYLNPADEKWYVIGKGSAAGAGVRFWTKYNGKYLVELRNPDHPIVVEVERNGDDITAQAHVVYD